MSFRGGQLIKHVSESRKRQILADAYEVTKPYIYGVEYLRVNSGYTMQEFVSKLKSVEISYGKRTHYYLLAGGQHTISTLMIAALCRLFCMKPYEVYHIGLRVLAGEQPDLTIYGITPEKRAVAIAERKLRVKLKRLASGR